jgi:hypothetical protein
MIYLKQSTASQEILLGPFVDSTDGVTAETGLTIANTDIKIHKAGATTLASKNSGGATHISNGNYYAVLDATDTDTLGSGCVIVQVSGALAVRVDICVLAANVFDSLIGGGDLLDVNTSQFGNTNGTFSGGRPEVNTTHAAGTAWGSGAITAASLAADAITAAKVADDVSTEIRTKLEAKTVLTGTVTTGASTTSVPTSALSVSGAAADQFKGRIIIFDNDTTTAALRGQATDITASSNAATPTFTVTALTTAPASGDTFRIV